jgi:hypothetical protein
MESSRHVKEPEEGLEKEVCFVAAHVMELPKKVGKLIGKKWPTMARYGGVLWGLTGVGEKNVRRFYQFLDERGEKIKRMVVIGFAGSLEKETTKGTLVSVNSVMDTKGGKYPLCPLPAQKVVVGLEVNHWTDKEEKKTLKERFPEASVIDMETGAHAKECEKRNITLSVLKVISDDLNEKIPSVSFIAEGIRSLPWKRLLENPVLFWRGFWFSLRLWGYRQRLTKWVKKLQESGYDFLENA